MYTFSAVIAAIFAWVLGFAYQRFRFFVLEREDARQLERAERGGCSQEWLASVSSQAAIGLVNPNTIEALVGLGLIERPAMAGRLATYNPSFVLSLVSWLPLFVLAALAFVAHNLLAIASFGVSSSPWLLMFNLSLVAIAMADARFRIIPIPFLLVLVAAGLLAFGMDDAMFYIMTFLFVSAVLWLGASMFERATGRLGVFGLGDVLLMSAVFAAFASFQNLALFAMFFVVLALASCFMILWGLRGSEKSWKRAVALRLPLGPALAVAAVLAPPLVIAAVMVALPFSGTLQ